MTVAVSLSLGLFVSLSCGRQALRHTGSAEWSGAQHTLQAEKAVEPHRSRARPLTLCLLRMKREDFITSCKTTPPPLQSPSSQALSPSLPSSLTTSPLPHSQPVARSRACPSQERGSRLPKKTSHRTACQCCAVHTVRERGTERHEEGDGETENWHIAYGLNPQTVICLFLFFIFLPQNCLRLTVLPVKLLKMQ